MRRLMMDDDFDDAELTRTIDRTGVFFIIVCVPPFLLWLLICGNAERVLPAILTYYRLSRMVLFLILDFIGLKLRMIISMIRRRRTIISKSEDSSPWSNKLPGDVMQLILGRLCLLDYIRCGAVCRFWQAIIKSNIRSRRPLARDQFPWLMLCSHPFSSRDNCFISPGDWKVHKFLRPLPNPVFCCKMNRMDCVGSIEGWLIMIDSALRRPEGFMKPWSFYLQNPRNFKIDFFFFNPISGDRVTLPSSQSTFPCHCKDGPGFSILKIVASSAPNAISREPCFVVSLCKRGHLTYCRPRDKSWTSIRAGVGRFIDIVIMGGKLYAATTQAYRFLMVFEMLEDANGDGNPLSYRVVKLVIVNPNTRPFVPLPSVEIAAGLCAALSERLVHYNGRELVYLAKDSASMELFMIFRKVDYTCKPDYIRAWELNPVLRIMKAGYSTPPKTKGFRVFKLEWDNINGGPQWVEVVELGDRILFVSNRNCAISYYPHGEKLERNNIYFALDYESYHKPSNGCDFGVFSLTNKTIRHFKFPKNCYRARLYTRPLWFVPNPW